MLHRDKTCRNCGWVTEYVYDIKNIPHYYCSNCDSQSVGEQYLVIPKGKNPLYTINSKK